jgi:NitT/TauT family transport system permease protein
VAAEATAVAVGEGLDRLELPVAIKKPRLRRVATVVLPKVAALAVLIGLWQLVFTLRLEPDYAIPSPGAVWATFLDQWHKGFVTQAIWTSISRAGFGYAVCLIVGTPFGLLVARVRILRLAVGSTISGLQTLPSVAWVPLGLVVFGPNETTIFFVVIMGAFPSIVNGMIHAVDQIPPLLLRAGRSMGARGLKLWWYVVVPAAMPGYIAGLRQAWSFSWRSLMAAELITRSADLGLGLGQLLDIGREFSAMDQVIMAILLILVVGIAVDTFVFNPLDRTVRQRRGLLVDA